MWFSQCLGLANAVEVLQLTFYFLGTLLMNSEIFQKMDAALAAAQEFSQSDDFKNIVKTLFLTKDGIEKFMPKNSDDPRFVVISGHLLIERIFDEFVRSNLKRPEILNGKEINFRQLVAFAQAMQSRDILQPWMYSSMKVLASLRDMYAHNVEPADGLKNIEKFLRIVKENEDLGQVKVEGRFSDLASAIIILGIRISGLLALSPVLNISGVNAANILP